MIVELTKYTLFTAESWLGNLSHNLPKMEAMCSMPDHQLAVVTLQVTGA